MDLIKRMKDSDFINWFPPNEFKKEILGEKAQNFKKILQNVFLIIV